jgi:hypothetical protein
MLAHFLIYHRPIAHNVLTQQVKMCHTLQDRRKHKPHTTGGLPLSGVRFSA